GQNQVLQTRDAPEADPSGARGRFGVAHDAERDAACADLHLEGLGTRGDKSIGSELEQGRPLGGRQEDAGSRTVRPASVWLARSPSWAAPAPSESVCSSSHSRAGRIARPARYAPSSRGSSTVPSLAGERGSGARSTTSMRERPMTPSDASTTPSPSIRGRSA